MKILPFISYQTQQLGIQPQQRSYNAISYNKTLSCDKFEYSNSTTTPITPTISFQSNVSNGQFLRKLSGIHDPYSGVVILNNKEMNQAYQDLSKLTTGRERITYLNQYEDSMLPVEKAVFNICKSEINYNKHLSLQQILTKKQPKALKNLIKEQRTVFNEIVEQIPTLSEENQHKVNSAISNAKELILLPHEDKNHFKKTRFMDELVRISQDKILRRIDENISQLPEEEQTNAKERLYETERILLNNPHNINVKGKTPLERVKELQVEFAPETLNEPNEIEPLIEIASKLPTSKDSINAYIVETYSKDDKTIAKRFISESLGTIEHIVPDSKGGANEAYNFLFVTKSRNEERGNMPMEHFLRKYPNIPNHCQTYINDMVKAGYSSKLRGHEWYPYVIKETMRDEIGANVALRDYRMSPQKAFKSFPNYLKERYPKFKKYFTNSQ